MRQITMQMIRVAPLLIVVLLLGHDLYGQDRLRLSEAECVQLGIENSDGLHASRMQHEYHKNKANEARTYLLPQLTGKASYVHLSEVPPFEVSLPPYPGLPSTFTLSESIIDTYGLTLNVSQPIFTGFKLINNLKMSSRNATAAGYDFEGDSSRTVFEIRRSYWTLYNALEFRSLVDENLKQVEAHLADAKNFMQQGLLTNNEVLKVETQLSQVRLLQIEADKAVRLAMVTLNSACGLPLGTTVEVASLPTGGNGNVPDLDSLLSRGVSARPELKAFRYRVSSAEAGVSIARSGWYPSIALTGNYYYSKPNSRIMPTKNEWEDTWDVGVIMSLDIWNWGRTVHQTRQAKAQLRSVRDALSQLEDAVQIEITASYLDVAKSEESIKVAREGVAQAEENYRITKEKFELGLASNTDLLDAEVALLQAKTSLTKSSAEYQIALADLERAVGR